MPDGLRFGSETYAMGALERLHEARILMDKERFALSVYVAGLSVEGMLRALIWRKDKKLDERHDLRRLAVRVDYLGLLRKDGRDHDFVGNIETVAKGWDNRIRYAGESQFKKFLFDKGLLKRKDRRPLKSFCRNYYNCCSGVIKRCEVLWRTSESKNSKKS